MKNKIVLVTGGAGYIGSCVTRHFLNKGLKVIVVDNLLFDPTSIMSFMGYKNYKFYKGDINDTNFIKNIFNENKIDYVIHLAAIVGENACKKDKNLTKKVNIDGTKSIFNISNEYKVKKFIFFSTCSSYGIQDTGILAHENSPLNPISLYAESKIGMEEYITSNSNSDTKYTILRPSTVHGPSPRMRFDLIVNHIVKDSVIFKKVDIYGGSLWRPLMWVGDAARAVYKVLSDASKISENNVYNMGNNGFNLRKIEIAEILKNKFLHDLKINEHGKDADLRSYKVDFSKIEKDLSFKHEKTIDAAMEELIFIYKSKIFLNYNSKKFRND
jgi:nucleoside-diphosphate-sugar epimerase